MSRSKTTRKPRLCQLGALLCLGILLALPSGASAAAPKWSLSIFTFPSSFSSGAAGNATEGPAYRVVATNTGDSSTTAPYTITTTLPADVSPVESEVSGKAGSNTLSCAVNGQEIICTGSEPLGTHGAVKGSGEAEVIIPVDVATGTAGKGVISEASVEGGGAPPAKAKTKTAVGLPAWALSGTSVPTNVPAGGTGTLFVYAVNAGAAGSAGTSTITATLPEGLVPTGAIDNGDYKCSIAGQSFNCQGEESILAGQSIFLKLTFKADLVASGTLVSEVAVEGGGAGAQKSTIPVTISPTVAPFGFLTGPVGLSAPLTAADGAAATQAGSHPDQLTVELGFPSEQPNPNVVTGADEVRNIVTELPPGMILNPNSTATRCAAAELLIHRCPLASQIGSVTTTVVLGAGTSVFVANPLFNMVPTPGKPSTFGFDAGESLGIFVRIDGALRSSGDYGLSGGSREILGRGPNPVLGLQLHFWGDPSASSHDPMRECGVQRGSHGICPEAIEESKTALLTAPVQCSGQPTITRARADSWEETGNFKHASYESADLAGTQVAMSGCNQLQYEPSIEAKPTTNLADSPSGLDVDIHQPVNEDPGGISPAMMKDLHLALPPGMSVNPSSADGLAACTEAQAHFHSLTPGQCPDDSKLGPVEVITPLLDHPITGALYLAQPLKNPTGSLIALYLELNDPSTGTVSNLAGKVVADPTTGQLTTVFEQNPQLPIEHIKTHLFTGPRAALRTPAACGTYSARADMTPWSAPQTPVAHPTDPFAIQANPNGGACPAQGQPLPSNPSFTAGTLDPQAGAYTPFVFKLTRQDDTAEVQKVDTTLPGGLTAKLAGVPYCPEAGIQRARSRSNPNEGIIERNDPSCPAASKVGTVKVASGAGITPLHVQGNAYLAGPYQGAPLSLAVITPAIAGPFDLGTVVVRIALHVDLETADVTATSEPLPRILYGIPLDIRQIAFELDRPSFTLNPTSCDPMSIGGSLTTAAGTVSPLAVPFQVGGCNALGFKPKLAIGLKGGTTRGAHPALTAAVTFPQSGKYANIKTAQVTLPHSEFLDQAHIGTVCTRVQFAADQCPAKSIYGKATATTPILDKPLSGPVYLRSSSHKLPDLVVDLHGQASTLPSPVASTRSTAGSAPPSKRSPTPRSPSSPCRCKAARRAC